MVEFVSATWREVARFIPPAFSRRPELVADVAAMVKDGLAAAFVAVEDGAKVGALVADGSGDTLRVLALAGTSGAGLLDKADAFVRDLARAAGSRRVIAHTTRPGMVVGLTRKGWGMDIATLSLEV